jgi:hypothetical protein
MGADITTQTQLFVSHINKLKSICFFFHLKFIILFLYSSFIPPTSTRDNAQKWYDKGYNMVNRIVNQRHELIQQINRIINNEISLLKKESKTIRVKGIESKVKY